MLNDSPPEKGVEYLQQFSALHGQASSSLREGQIPSQPRQGGMAAEYGSLQQADNAEGRFTHRKAAPRGPESQPLLAPEVDLTIGGVDLVLGVNEHSGVVHYALHPLLVHDAKGHMYSEIGRPLSQAARGGSRCGR